MYRRSVTLPNPPSGSNLEEVAARLLWGNGIEEPQRQYQFSPTRRFRADFAWPKYMIILEIDGGTYSRRARKCPVCGRAPTGAHNTPSGYESDRERDAHAAILGWTVIRVTTRMVQDGRMVDIIKQLLVNRRQTIG